MCECRATRGTLNEIYKTELKQLDYFYPPEVGTRHRRCSYTPTFYLLTHLGDNIQHSGLHCLILPQLLWHQISDLQARWMTRGTVTSSTSIFKVGVWEALRDWYQFQSLFMSPLISQVPVCSQRIELCLSVSLPERLLWQLQAAAPTIEERASHSLLNQLLKLHQVKSL